MNHLPLFALITLGQAIKLSSESGNIAPLLLAPIAIAVAAAYL